MKKKYIIARLDEVINSGNLKKEEKKKLIEVKKEVQRSAYVSEVLSIFISYLIKVFGDDFGLFE